MSSNYNNNFEEVVCNLCKSNDYSITYESTRDYTQDFNLDEFRSSGDEILKDRLIKCDNCGLSYVSPRVQSDIMLKGYKESVDKTFVSQVRGREITSRYSMKRIQSIWGKSPAKLLDIGTANGSFLKVAKNMGWEVYGCEPNKWMCQWSKENYDIILDEGTLFDAKYNSNYFNVISLWDVIEHTPNPKQILFECNRILQRDGLLIANFPDFGSWISKFMGKKWVFLLTVHYYYFTKKTLSELMNKSGFEVILIKPHFQTLELDYILFRSIQYIGFVGKVIRKLVQIMGLKKINVPYWIGQSLIVAKKNNS
tara:strand:+ start:620 stop:1549 length:930 start_codon:yes stop_codon:yes gene_type:complete